MSGWFTKSTTLVNDTEYKVIIIDHDNTRDLKPGTSQGNTLAKGFSIDLEIRHEKDSERKNLNYENDSKYYMSNFFKDKIAAWKLKQVKRTGEIELSWKHLDTKPPIAAGIQETDSVEMEITCTASIEVNASVCASLNLSAKLAGSIS